jgi:hypothetical protein
LRLFSHHSSCAGFDPRIHRSSKSTSPATTARKAISPLPHLPSPAAAPPARGEQYDAGDRCDDAVLGMHARNTGLMTRHEARQLIRRRHEIDGGNDEEDDAEQRKYEFHGTFLWWPREVWLDSLGFGKSQILNWKRFHA